MVRVKDQLRREDVDQSTDPGGAGADFLQLHAADAPARGVADWLAAAVRAAVVDGRVAAGTRLPATRALAADLGLSRGVVVEAYQRLQEQGLEEARTGAGTVVAHHPLRQHRPASPASSPLVRLPVPVPANGSGLIDLSPGVPDVTCFPRAAWLRHERAVLDHATVADLGYGNPLGHPQLHRELAAWLTRTRALHVEPDDILVVAGVAQSLALLCDVLRRRGVDRVAVEDPGSRGARDEVAYWGLTPVAIPVDGDGINVDDLERGAADVALVTPAHHFPTGVVLGPQRRRRLLAWAAKGGDRRSHLIIEDDYDAEHRYDRSPVAALQPAAPEHVAHTGSVSKTLAPAMRLGWLVPPRSLLPDLARAKHASDLGNPALPQLILTRMLASGDYDRHLRSARGRQRQRRDALIAALHEHVPDVAVSGVAAGLHLLATLPDCATDDVALTDRIRDAGVVVHPLSWHRVSPGPPGLVLGYAAHSPDQLRRAVRRLASALAE